VAAKQGQTRKPAGRQRLALILFGALLVLLFVGFAIEQGIGQPSVPSGDVALVKGVPSDIGHISETEFKRSILQQVAQGGLKKPPKPGEAKYDEVKEAALGQLLDTIWIQGEAEELGLAVTPKQVSLELAKIKKQSFPTKAAFKAFLKKSHFTQEDVVERVKLQVLSTRIQEAIAAKAPPPSTSEVADYYNQVKATQFTKAASRDIRVVVNNDKSKVEQAKAVLEKDDSPASWKKVTVKYSTDPTTKSNGGLQPALSEELLASQPELKDAVFGAQASTVVGPVNIRGKWFVLEVVKLNPEKVQGLKEVEAQIRGQLTQQVAQEVFSGFIADYQSKWTSRTFCASGFVIERCANYVGDGHPSTAPPACYEANPKGGTPSECPAPVTQVAPAIPGSTTILKPQGERVPQRPRPEGLEETGEEAGPLGLPETAAPAESGE
jgi:parvulin-like peptidyl-prolyl isomerase